ncbi:hypothetical protein HanIR_Chr04g0172361 [Helianthus annuus]|nr:hypothetical protein HanIR_Chr04g0172361 [Helianthus annuus]
MKLLAYRERKPSPPRWRRSTSDSFLSPSCMFLSPCFCIIVAERHCRSHEWRRCPFSDSLSHRPLSLFVPSSHHHRDGGDGRPIPRSKEGRR